MKAKTIRLGVTVGVMAVLGACGQLARLIPPQSMDDMTLPLHDSAGSSGKVLYQDVVAAHTAGRPELPVRYRVSGDVTYHRAGGTLEKVNVYARSSLEDLPGSCVREQPGMVTCDVGSEAGQRVGSMTLRPDVGVPFSLSGSAIT